MPTPLAGACPAIAPESSEEQLMLSQQLTLISQLADELLMLANDGQLLTGQGRT